MYKETFDLAAFRAVVISTLAMGVGASMGFIPGFLATTLQNDLGIKLGQIGLLVSVHFGATGIGSILGGRICERFGARSAVATDAAVVGVFSLLAAYFGSYWMLLLAAVPAGFSYSLANAGTNVAVAKAVPENRRTVSLSIKTSGVPIMAAIASAMGPWVASEWSWETVMALNGVVALIVCLLAVLVLESDRLGQDTRSSTQRLPNKFIWFPIGAFLLIAGTQPLFSWSVPYLEQSLDAAPAVAGGVVSIASLLGVVVMIFNGFRTDLLGSEQRINRMVKMLLLASFSVLIVPSALVVGLWAAVLGIVVGLISQLVAIGVMHAALVDRAPYAVARATGMTMTGYYLGALFSPVGFGALVDLTDTYAYVWVVMSALLFLSVPAFLLAGRIPVIRQDD